MQLKREREKKYVREASLQKLDRELLTPRAKSFFNCVYAIQLYFIQ